MHAYSHTAKVVAKWVLIALILATLVFIFTNSLKSPEQSLEDSNAVGGILSTIFPPDTDLGAFIEEYVRKIAHFTEYGLLGIEVALYVCFYTKRRVRCALVASASSFFVGFIDETLQYISGRGPAISDVWVDVGGFVLFSLIVYGAFALVHIVGGKLIPLMKKNGVEGENG